MSLQQNGLAMWLFEQPSKVWPTGCLIIFLAKLLDGTFFRGCGIKNHCNHLACPLQLWQAMMGTVKYWFEEWASSASPSKRLSTEIVALLLLVKLPVSGLSWPIKYCTLSLSLYKSKIHC